MSMDQLMGFPILLKTAAMNIILVDATRQTAATVNSTLLIIFMIFSMTIPFDYQICRRNSVSYLPISENIWSLTSSRPNVS